MMQYLRNVDWAKTPEVRSPVYDGHKLYDARAMLTGTSANVMFPQEAIRLPKSASESSTKAWK